MFLLGQVTDKLVMSELREENLASGDLVQISVRDHYTALSYKTLSGFIWVNRSLRIMIALLYQNRHYF